MPRALGIIGLGAVVLLTVAWWATRGGGRFDPAAPRSTPPSGAPPSAPVAPEVEGTPTLVGAPDAAPAESTAAADGPSVLTGRVLRLDTRKPVVAASVGIRSGERELARTSTGPGGRFRLEAKVPDTGPWGDPLPLLVAEAEGLTTLQAVSPGRGSVSSGDVGDLILEPALTVRGAVRGEDGERIADARVVIQPDRPADGAQHRAGSWGEVALRQRGQSDADGHFAFTGLPPRPFDLEVRVAGYVSAWYRGRAVADGAWLDVRLRRGRSMRVRVEDPDGDPVVGARVNLYMSPRVVFAGHYKTHLRLDRSTVTDALGRCVLTGLQDRKYQITAQSHGLAGAATYVLPGWSETVVRLTPGWRSSRYVYDDGPGAGGGILPPGLDGTYAWTCWPPESESPAAPANATASPAPDEDEDEEEEERSPPPPDRARLHLTVLSADGVPMPDAYVGFAGPDEAAAITEEDGTEIVTLHPGRYAYRVSPIDFGTLAADHHGTVDAEGGVESSFVFRLPRVYAVTVQVQTADGEALPRARLEVLRGEKSKSRWTDSEGRVTLFAERGQPFSLLSQPEGQPAAFLRDVELPVSRPVILRAPRSASLRGRVLGPDGVLVFGAYVEARREGLAAVGKEEWTAFTDDRGGFVLEGPAQARYRISAHHRAFGAASVVLDVGPGTEPLTFRLQPLARFRGRLVDEAGEPIAGAEIELREGSGGRGYGWVGSGADGRFEIALPRGDRRDELVVEHEGFVTRVVSMPPGALGELEIRLAAR